VPSVPASSAEAAPLFAVPLAFLHTSHVMVRSSTVQTRCAAAGSTTGRVTAHAAYCQMCPLQELLGEWHRAS
jgi:hypothetical protein